MTRRAAVWWSLPALLLLPTLGHPPPLVGQSVTGAVHDRETGAPVPGAMVALLEEGGEQVASVVTDGEGTFRIRAPTPGPYRLRVDRIGFRSEIFDPFEVEAGETVAVRLQVGSRAIELPPVTVEAEGVCEIPSEEGLLISDIWDEARKALELSVATREARALHVRGREHERTLDLVSLRVLDEGFRSWSGFSRDPYFAEPPEDLARMGYVRETPEGHTYFGLAPETLLSRPFQETHCFRVRPPGRDRPASEIGLGFEPAPGRTTPDVSGVLWLDRESARLLRVEYAYTRHLHPVPLPEERFGGRTDFRWLEDGTVIVEGWSIRMPLFERIVSTDDLPRGTVVRGGAWADREWRDQLRRLGLSILEIGGTVTSVAVAGQAASGTAVVEGMVHDSIRGAPLEDALVYVIGTERQVTTDAEGRFRIAELPSGPLEVSFQHPLLDDLAASPEPRTVDAVSGETVRVELAIPSATTVFGARCDDNEAWVAGFVRDRTAGLPLEGVVVVAEWEERWRLVDERRLTAEPMRRAAVTDQAGAYVICEVRPGAAVRVSAELEGALRRTEVRVEEGRGGRADFAFGPELDRDAPTETGRVALGLIRGRVLEEPGDAPLSGLDVELLTDAGETVARTHSNRTGGFVLPVGSGNAYRIRASGMGRAQTVTEPVQMETGDTLDVAVRVGAQPIQLPELEVVARARPGRVGRLADFYFRAERGQGSFLMRDDIEARGPIRLAHMLLEHGMEVVQVGSGTFDMGIVNRRTGCAPMVYLDGMRLTHGTPSPRDSAEAVGLVDPLDVEGVEIYRGAATIPGEFGGSTAQCGVIVIWTRVG